VLRARRGEEAIPVRKSLGAGLALLGLALVVSGLGQAAAAATTGTVTVTFTILSHQVLTITGDPLTVSFGDLVPDVASSPASVQVKVKSNVRYDLSYTATDFTDGGSNTVPIGRLTYNGTPFSNSGVLEDGKPRTTGTGDTYNYSYVLTVSWDDEPASYSGTVTYAVTPD